MLKFDRGNLNILETGEGFLKAKVTFAIPGVFPYIYADGVRMEAKLPGDILSHTTIESANGAPITDSHPENVNGDPILVDTSNYKKFAKGNISNSRVEINEGIGLVTIYDADLIGKVKNKEQYEVSIGFKCDEIIESGFFDGIHFDSKQENIIINHVAIVDKGRAGHGARIHIDRSQKMSDKKNEGKESSRSYNYRKFDGSKDIVVEKEILDELILLNKKIKADENELKNIKDKLTKEKDLVIDAGENEKIKKLLEENKLLKDKMDAWTDKFAAFEKSVPKKVKDAAEIRVKLIESAKNIDSNLQIDSMSNKEIKLQIISKGLPFEEGIKIDSMSDEAIDARYDAAIELLKVQANLPISNNTLIKIDRTEINKKRNALQNIYKEGGN